MKYKIDNQDLQDNEVSEWWNSEKTKKWHHYTYDKENYLSHHLILRQKKVLEYLDSLNLPSGSRIIELGCGAGQLAKKICDLGYNYVGLDISKHLCEESEKKCKKYVDEGSAVFINQSIEKQFNIKDLQFDVCIIVGSIQYVGNLENCFEEIKKSLKKNAHIIICQANMYPLVDIIYPRQLLLKLVYFFCDEEFLISPSLKSILCESKLKKYFKKYENSKIMNTNFMTKGSEELRYKIRKRLYSYRRLKNIMKYFDFKIVRKTGATFFFPKKNFFYFFWYSLDLFLQKLLDFKILGFLINFSDNIIILGKKNENKNL